MLRILFTLLLRYFSTQQQDLKQESVRVQPTASTISFFQPSSFICFILFFWEVDETWNSSWLSGRSSILKANGAQLCLVLITVLPVQRDQFGVALGRPIPFLASSFCDGLEKRTGGPSCVTLRHRSNLIISDGTYCADASDCVSWNPGSVQWSSFGGEWRHEWHSKPCCFRSCLSRPLDLWLRWTSFHYVGVFKFAKLQGQQCVKGFDFQVLVKWN